jgi:hypothetical protein
MAALRATQFFTGTVMGASSHLLYTVPSGHRIILKTVVMLNQSATASDWQLRVQTLGAFVRGHLASYGGAGDSTTWSGWVVLDEGQTLYLTLISGATFQAVASGSLLFI